MKTSNLQTVSLAIRNSFSNEIREYTKSVLMALENQTPMPSVNLIEINKKYLEISVKELKLKGVSTPRAKSISKYTLDKIQETEMLSVES